MKIRVKLQAVVELSEEQAKEFKFIKGRLCNMGDGIFLIGFNDAWYKGESFPRWSIDNKDEYPKKYYDDYEVEKFELVKEEE